MAGGKGRDRQGALFLKQQIGSQEVPYFGSALEAGLYILRQWGGARSTAVFMDNRQYAGRTACCLI